MSMIVRVAKELLGLFVDDGSLALAILAWVAIFAALMTVVAVPPTLAGLVLFLGLIAILAENAVRRARKR